MVSSLFCAVAAERFCEVAPDVLPAVLEAVLLVVLLLLAAVFVAVFLGISKWFVMKKFS
jgi:hypothetical protein